MQSKPIWGLAPPGSYRVNSANNVESEAELLKKTFTQRQKLSVINLKHVEVSVCPDISIAIKKLKPDKVNDNGLVYSNNFKHGTELLFQYLSILFTSMVHRWLLSINFYNVLTLFLSRKVQKQTYLTLISTEVNQLTHLHTESETYD